MITCPWCGTNYAVFQPNCQNCGGPLPIPAEAAGPGLGASIPDGGILTPPPPPRPIANSYAWRLLTTDGWAIAALVFCILGAVFTLVGIVLTIAIVTAFVGIPFALLGLVFLGAGAAIGQWRYREMQMVVNVLRAGEATEGQITGVEQNFHVSVNGRNPWVIRYQFQLDGQAYDGKVSTLNMPGTALQPGRPACVLYLPQAPARNSLYPHP